MRALSRAAAPGWLLLAPGPAAAHGGGHAEAASTWSFDPWVVLPLVVSLLLYAGGTAALWRRAGWGRGVRLWQTIAYGLGWLALVGALVSPLHWLGEHLFTAHMVEHEVIMALAAPCLVLARPVGAFLWALPPGLRCRLGQIARRSTVRATWRAVTRPLAATVLHGVAIWAWHVPALFDATVIHVGLHRLQHLSFLVTALLFWWALLRRCDAGAASVHLFLTMLHTGALGALLAFAPQVFYAVQTAGAAGWGLSPLEDQQLAGLVMWIPAGTVYAGAGLLFLARWIGQSGQGWKASHALRVR
jgi:putative membrane protein